MGQPTRGGRPSPPHGSPNWTRGGGGAPFPSPTPSPFPPFPTHEKERGILLGLGVLVGLPPWRAPLVAGLLLPFFIYVGRGALQSTTVILLAVCGAPSTVYSSGHSVVVLRRSPARITSPSPSPRRRADKTLPRHFAGSIVRGTSSR